MADWLLLLRCYFDFSPCRPEGASRCRVRQPRQPGAVQCPCLDSTPFVFLRGWQSFLCRQSVRWKPDPDSLGTPVFCEGGGSSRSVLYFAAPVLYHIKGVTVTPWSIAMIDRSVRQQFLVFLATVACLSMSLQTAGHLSFSEANHRHPSVCGGFVGDSRPRCRQTPRARRLVVTSTRLPSLYSSYRAYPVPRCRSSAAYSLRLAHPSQRASLPKFIARQSLPSEFLLHD